MHISSYDPLVRPERADPTTKVAVSVFGYKVFVYADHRNVLTKPNLPVAKKMVQEMGLICMLSTKVVVSVFGLQSICLRGPPKQSDAL